MDKQNNPGPGAVYQKANGNWSFPIFPDGVALDTAEFPSEQAALDARETVRALWLANGERYGTSSIVTDQSKWIVGP